MGVVSFIVFLFGFGFIVFLAFYSEYKYLFRKYKPDYFGLDIFQHVTRWQTSEWQDQANRKGITQAEWQRLCDEQLCWVDTALNS